MVCGLGFDKNKPLRPELKTLLFVNPDYICAVLEETKKRIEKGEMLPLMEDFYTIQGEGFHTGKAAYFIRIGGCDVGCHWCDVKESWNAELHPPTSTDEIVSKADQYSSTVVITGGEPLMWSMDYLTEKLRERGLKIHIETSGAYPLSGILTKLPVTVSSPSMAAPRLRYSPLQAYPCSIVSLKASFEFNGSSFWFR